MRYAIRSTKTKLRGGKEVQHCLIVVVNSKGNYVIHPLSNIFLKEKGKKYNTQKTKAQALVSFLNWYCTNHLVFREREPVLSELNFFKMEYYLNYLVESNKSASTVNSSKAALISLLRYLDEINILNVNTKEEFARRINAGNELFQLLSKPSTRSNNNLIHEIKKEYIPMFLDLAFREVNIIALGVCIQMFGGLRTGECVNLTRESIMPRGAFGSGGLELNIKYRNLRPQLRDYDGGNGVKKERSQVVFPNRFLPTFLEYHLKNYEDTTGKNALFVDSTGEPMTGRVYQYYFRKLKDLFIENLLNSSNLDSVNYGLYLKTRKWSSHVCRGTFSNWIAESTSNPMDLALARGDSDINSSLTYMEHSETFMNGVKKVVEVMFEEAKEY